MPDGVAPEVGSGNSVTVPDVVIRPRSLPVEVVNQRLSSGPVTTSLGRTPQQGPRENSAKTPAVEMRPILLLPASANQRLPSGPAVIPQGVASDVGMVNSVIEPVVVTRAIRLPTASVTQRLPSEPATMSSGWLPALNAYVVIDPPGVIFPTMFVPYSTNHMLPSGPRVDSLRIGAGR